MTVAIEWLGCATFRLTVDGLVVFLDAYMDRVPSAPNVGLSAGDVDRADFVIVGHSHFDHLAGAEVIARNTGARIIASNESCQVMRRCEVPREQLLPSQGGERHRLSGNVTVRVFPSLHACTWTALPSGVGEAQTGDLGLSEDDRRSMMLERGLLAAVRDGDAAWSRAFQEHARSATGSGRDGGPLVYLIETAEGTVFYQDTSGCWSGVLRDLRADVAILALSGRANLDGEPFQGSLAEFAGQEASWLRASTVLFGHHDNWLGMPGRPDVEDITPARREVERVLPDARVVEMRYREQTGLLGQE
jgi:L-ascorbate metabolism protein UlaG (beta-lactamase superfamily)